jgi:hypothetical protein
MRCRHLGANCLYINIVTEHCLSRYGNVLRIDAFTNRAEETDALRPRLGLSFADGCDSMSDGRTLSKRRARYPDAS